MSFPVRYDAVQTAVQQGGCAPNQQAFRCEEIAGAHVGNAKCVVLGR